MKLIIKILIALFLFLLVLVIGLAACTGLFVTEVDKEMKKDSTVSVPSKEGSSEEQQDKLQKLKFGDTFQVGDVEFTVSKPRNEKPGEFDSPKSGNIVVFDITAKNKGKAQAFIDSGEFSLYDANGEKIETAYLGDDYGIQDDVNAGRTLKGTLLYDTKAGQQLELVYAPNFSWEDVEVVLKGKN